MSDDWNDGPATAAPASGFGAMKGFGRGVLRPSSSEEPKVGSGFGGGDGASGFAKMNGSSGGFGSSGASNGFGGGKGGGFGGGRGGFGQKSGENSDSGVSNGFGGGNKGGFGGGFGRKTDSESTGGGFGSSGGGFGSKGGFGKKSEDGEGGGGFGSKGGFGGGGGFGSDRPPRGGGFGGGSGFGRGRGRISGGDASGNKGCFKCGEEGHFSRECPSGGGGGGGGSKACFKCGEEGHFSRECPSAGGGGGGGGGGSKACFKCGEEGHFSRECPSAGGGGGGGGSGGKGCFKCGEEGHFSRECPNAEKSGVSLDSDRPPPYIPPAPPEDEEEIFKSITKGINFDNYDKIHVEVTGREAPRCIARFDDAGLYEAFLANVKKAKYEKPTPVQKYSMPIIMAGRDLMACAQTGSGKTAAFILPTMTGMMQNGLTGSQFSDIQEPQALIVAPTRELAVQIYMDARKFAYGTMLRPVVVYGGTSVGYQLRQVEQGTHILVGTPGRLLDVLGKGKVGLSKIKYLILDEADRMLDMGFGPDVKRIVEDFGMPGKTERQTLMFSATFPVEIQKLAGEFLNDYLFLSVGVVGGANTDVSQHFFEIERLKKRDKLIEILKEAGTEKTLVFVEQKRNADFLASMLSQSGFPTTSIHGDRLQREREEALQDFKIGRAPILIATSVAARGLDIPEVKHVINYDLPQSIDEYVHRIGRTGRCGNLGKATSFFSNDSDSGIAKALVKILSEAAQVVPEWLEEYAKGSISTAGYMPMGGKFGGKDIRKGMPRRQEEAETGGGFGGSGFGGGGFGGSSFGGGGGGGDDEESWD